MKIRAIRHSFIETIYVAIAVAMGRMPFVRSTPAAVRIGIGHTHTRKSNFLGTTTVPGIYTFFQDRGSRVCMCGALLERFRAINSKPRSKVICCNVYPSHMIDTYAFFLPLPASTSSFPGRGGGGGGSLARQSIACK